MSQEQYDWMLSTRGIEEWDICPGCAGVGNKVYASTSTYMGGIGGAALTNDTCDECWGTGKQSHIGVDIRRLNKLISLVSKQDPPSPLEITAWLKAIRPQVRIIRMRQMSARVSQAQAKPTESSPAQDTSSPKKRGSTRKKKKAPSRKAGPTLTMPSNA